MAQSLLHAVMTSMLSNKLLLLVLSILLLLQQQVAAQYTIGDPRYDQIMSSQEELLVEELKSGDYVEKVFYPARSYANIDVYSYDEPPSRDYAIGLIIDPCKGGEHDCCNQVYGTPEYALLKDAVAPGYRIVEKTVFAAADEILDNVDLVDEEGSSVDTGNSRLADDEIYIDERCKSDGVPYRHCTGNRQAMRRSPYTAPCMDNNQTVDATAGCITVEGVKDEHCLAVGYSQTAFSVQCGGEYQDDVHCGTFIELHMAQPNNYADVEDILADVKIDTVSATGYSTTTVLCAYDFDSILVDNTVLIAEDAPVCCCPSTYSQGTQIGGFVCPVINGNEGPFATIPTSVSDLLTLENDLDSFPYCPYSEDSDDGQGSSADMMMVAASSSAWQRFYTRQAEAVKWENDTRGYTSADLQGTYDNQCDYFDSCGLAGTTGCVGSDREWTFAGYVGIVTSVPGDSSGGQYGVTFNGGRTRYYFNEEDVMLEYDHNYELWWVQRTRYNFIVQKRKPFYVASPVCTFDSTNNQYFPYTMIDGNGQLVT